MFEGENFSTAIFIITNPVLANRPNAEWTGNHAWGAFDRTMLVSGTQPMPGVFDIEA
jgi:hypothetical protein